VWAWALAQYPHLLQPGLTIAQAAASRAVLENTLICLGIGAVILVPSLVWLYSLFQRSAQEPTVTGR
jgi:cytochrome bd ubiquinol oxidase subunit II